MFISLHTARRWTRRPRSCVRWRRSPSRRCRVLKLFGNTTRHAGRSRPSGPSRNISSSTSDFYLHRPDLIIDRPDAVRRAAAQGPGAGRPLFRRHPGARAGLHAGRRSASCTSSACRPRPGTTRSRPDQFEIAPIFEDANVAADRNQI
ncbi:MAG: hypothetical protein MZU84_02185 [Sphingobacterium sp.]|nr:hypothetical protein [Sphingobacterium sp.]